MKTTVNAKITIQGQSRPFNLTIDWDKMQEDEMRALAQRSIVIAWQNKHRVANEGAGEWPSSFPEIKAVDYRLGVRTQIVKDPVKMIEAGEFTPEQLAHLANLIKTKMASQG
jgi:hypothetical protein